MLELNNQKGITARLIEQTNKQTNKKEKERVKNTYDNTIYMEKKENNK